MSRWLVTPDSRIGWIAPAVRSGLVAVRRRRPDVIYSTSPYMSAHLIGMILSRLAHLPWVADFRDPWRGNPFRDLGSSSIERWDDFLEWSVLKSASYVICNTPAMTEELRRRRPFVKGKSTTILNGFDPELLEGINPKRVAPADEFVLAHTGQFYGPRSPVVWFRAFRRALDRTPEPAAAIHMLLVGPEQFEQRHLRDWAREAGVERNVRVLGRKSHAETLSYLAGSDVLMLAGSAGVGGHLQIPNKLFEYLAIRKPIIATCPAASPIAEVLRQARAAALTCEPNDDTALADAIRRLAIHRDTGLGADWGGLDRFDRVHRAKELAAIFDGVSRAHGSETARVLTSVTA